MSLQGMHCWQAARHLPKLCLVVLALLPACTRSDTDSDTAGGPECHPLVPEQFCFLWTVDTPCERAGMPGRRIYRIASGGVMNADGTGSIVERWYWFSGDPSAPERDVVDEIRWDFASTHWTTDQMGCSGCERAFSADFTILSNPSNWSYEDRRGAVFAFDTLNANDGFNEDYGMFVLQGLADDDSLSMYWPDYAVGSWRPDSDVPGELPAAFAWEPSSPLGECK